MRDRLKRSWWVNLPSKNPTQTRYTRFLKTPTGFPRTRYDAVLERAPSMDDWKTYSHYSKMMET